MKKYFEYHSKLEQFRMFSTDHLTTMAIIMIACILLFVFRKKLEEKGNRRLFRISLAVLILTANVSYHLWLIIENAWTVKKSLPLQLSDLVAFIAVIMLLTKSFRLFQFMYFAGTGSAIQAILTPDLHYFSFPHFLYFESFISHGGVVIACLFMAAALHYRPTLPSMWVTILLVTLYGTGLFFLNKILDSNYMYIMNKAGMSPLDFLGPWPWYLLMMEMAMIVGFYILYSPFWIKSKMEQRFRFYFLKNE